MNVNIVNAFHDDHRVIINIIMTRCRKRKKIMMLVCTVQWLCISQCSSRSSSRRLIGVGETRERKEMLVGVLCISPMMMMMLHGLDD